MPMSSEAAKPGDCSDSRSTTTDSAQSWQSQAACDVWAYRSGAQSGQTDTGGTDKQAAPSDAGGTQAQQSGHRHGWTVAIDLTTDLPDEDDPSHKFGAHSQFKKLSELAAQTAGTDVTMVVQLPRDPDPGQPQDKSAPPTIDRYVIRNGQIQKIDSEQSQGMATNLQHLLERAATVAPSDKLGLVCQSHGASVHGIGGGTGEATMGELTEAIKKGLKGSGHDRLDLLDFDSCEMASTAVLGKVSSIASMVVASEEPEAAGKGYDGQNLKSVMSDLLQHPDMSAKELSDDFVHAADRGDNGTPTKKPDSALAHAGTDTLASFDTAKYGEFRSALDGLGSTLSKASTDSKTRQAIQQVIDATQQLPLDMADKDIGSRDISEFCRLLKQAVSSGCIKDTDGSIEKAAGAVVAAQSKLTSAYHAEHGSAFDKLGGLDTFLPGSEIRDDEARAARLSPLTMLQDATNAEEASKVYGHRDDAVAMIKAVTKQCADGLSPEGQKAFAPVLQATRQLDEARTEDDFKKAYENLHQAAAALHGTTAERDILKRSVEFLRKYKARLVACRDVPDAPHWDAFVHAMAGVT